jgi:dipeptidase E
VRRLLLLSNSTNHGAAYLDHAWHSIAEHLRGVKELVFVPFALRDLVAYTAKVRDRFAREGFLVRGLLGEAGDRVLLERAEAVFVGGGNTFRLLDLLQRGGLVALLRRRVREGMPYLGASAGSNVACPTLKTTNDMPIAQPASFQALHLLGFQLNPHYLDADPGGTHMGETREQRILEYLEDNETPVVGLREGSWLRVHDRELRLLGPRPARVFRRGQDPIEVAPWSDLAPLVEAGGPPPGFELT